MLSKISKSGFKLIAALEQADLNLFRIVPSRVKKRFVEKVIALFPSSLSKEPLEVNGVMFYSPGSLRRRMSLISGNNAILSQMKRSIRPNMVVVDVGANIGYHTLFMARLVGAKGKVYAVEPGSDNLEFLYKNVQVNGLTNVEIVPYAAGSTNQVRNFYLRRGDKHSFFSKHPLGGKTDKTVQVEERPLDDVIKDKVDFVKIDVEGAEIEVLKGMKQILQSNRGLELIVEWNPSAQQEAGYAAERLPNFLTEAGFSISIVDGEIEPLPSVETALEFLRANASSNHLDLYARR